MNAVLHLVFRSARQGDGLNQCLGHLAAGDALVLLEESVVEALATGGLRLGLERVDVTAHVLRADLERRGLGQRQLIDGIKPIDYHELVALVTGFKLCQTWS